MLPNAQNSPTPKEWLPLTGTHFTNRDGGEKAREKSKLAAQRRRESRLLQVCEAMSFLLPGIALKSSSVSLKDFFFISLN